MPDENITNKETGEIPIEANQTVINIGNIALLPADNGRSAVCVFNFMGVYEVRIGVNEQALKEFDQARLAQKKQALDILRVMPKNLKRVD